MSGRGFKKTTSEGRGRGQFPRKHKELLKGQVKQLNLLIETVDIILNVGLKHYRD